MKPVARLTLLASLVAASSCLSVEPAAAVSAPGPDAFGYTVKEVPNNLRNIFQSGGAPVQGVDDDTITGPIPLGFSFSYYGNIYTDVYISSNGFLTFNQGYDSGCCEGQTLPNSWSSPSNLVAAFWNDLYPPNSPVGLFYQTVGTSGSREFILGYYDVPNYTDGPRVTAEIILYEATHNIELQYGSALNDGSPVTAGISNNGNSDALTLINADGTYGEVGLSNRGFMFSSVPGPLPILGASVAFGWTRRIRNRIRRS